MVLKLKSTAIMDIFIFIFISMQESPGPVYPTLYHDRNLAVAGPHDGVEQKGLRCLLERYSYRVAMIPGKYDLTWNQ